MKKVIRDGMIAVLYSSGYGWGWYSWNQDRPECLFDPDIVELVEKKAGFRKIEEVASAKWETDEKRFCSSGAGTLKIKWLPIGTQFRIDEYDGFESVILIDQEKVLIA